MIPRIAVFLAFALLVGQCFAAAPVATVSSTQPVLVSGIAVPTNRVISWPVGVNDEITTQGATALVRFTDGSVVTLQRNSRMRLESNASGVEVKMLSGSAIYDVKPKSTVSVTPALAQRSAAPVSPAAVVPSARSASSTVTDPQAVALAYRMPEAAPKQGIIYAPTAIGTGTFLPATVRFDTTTPGSGAKLILPGSNGGQGAILEGHVVTQGGSTIFVIDKIEVPVVTPNGQTIYVTANSPALIGASAVISNTGVNQQQQVQIFPSGSGTPLTGSQVASSIQTAATSSYNSSVQNGQLPAGTSAPQPPSPITTGTFSGVS